MTGDDVVEPREDLKAMFHLHRCEHHSALAFVRKESSTYLNI